MEPAGYGSFNCTAKTERGTLLRFGQDTERARRASAIEALLSEHAHILGPSTLRVLQPGRVATASERRSMQRLTGCRAWDEAWLEELEYARGGDLSVYGPRDAQQVRQFALCLAWFLGVAQREWGFWHHDLKPQNVVVRTTPTPLHYVLAPFEFCAQAVPVVIDYDFASVLVTNQTAATGGGTRFYMTQEREPERNAQHYRTQKQSYRDEWALGMTLLRWCMQLTREEQALLEERAPYDFFDVMYRDVEGWGGEYATFHELQQEEGSGSELGPFIENTSVYYWQCVLQALVGNPVGGAEGRVVSDTIPSSLRAAYEERARPLLGDDGVAYVRMLLSWRPEDRARTPILQQPYFAPLRGAAQRVYRYEHWSERTPLYLRTTDDAFREQQTRYLAQRPLLQAHVVRTAMCASCTNTQAIDNMCPCCGLLFCNECCQVRHHFT